MITDSHCHLDYPNIYNQLDAVIKRAKYNQVKYLLTICTTLESFERIKLMIHKYENIYGTFGIHPHETKKFTNIDTRFILDLKKLIILDYEEPKPKILGSEMKSFDDFGSF